MERRETICLDFDGVVHSYSSGWRGATVIPDPPVPGAFEKIREYLVHYDVAIFSARSHEEGGTEAMLEWFLHHAGYSYAKRPDWIAALRFPKHKPPAHIYIDDRGYHFSGPGSWPTIEYLRAFKPWNKRPDYLEEKARQGGSQAP